MKFRPINNKVIVKQHEADETSQGGIVIANATEKPLRGTVIAVGPGRWLGSQRIEPTVKEGDIVLFGKSAGEEIDVGTSTDEDMIRVLRENEILAKLDV